MVFILIQFCWYDVLVPLNGNNGYIFLVCVFTSVCFLPIFVVFFWGGVIFMGFFYLLTWKLVIKNGSLSGLNKPYHGKLIMHYKGGVLAFIKLFECNPDALLQTTSLFWFRTINPKWLHFNLSVRNDTAFLYDPVFMTNPLSHWNNDIIMSSRF